MDLPAIQVVMRNYYNYYAVKVVIKIKDIYNFPFNFISFAIIGTVKSKSYFQIKR